MDHDLFVWLYCAALEDATSFVDAVALDDAAVFEKLPPLWMLLVNTRFVGYTATDCPLYIFALYYFG